MAGVNKVIIMGNVGNEPELTYTQGGMAVCKFSVATSKKVKDGSEKTSWHRCVSFGKTAEAIRQYIGKGSGIYIDGELSYGQYEKDGITRYTTDILVNEFSFTQASRRPGERQDVGQGSHGHQGNTGSGSNNNYQYKGNAGAVSNRCGTDNRFDTPSDMNDYFLSPPKDDDIPF